MQRGVTTPHASPFANTLGASGPHPFLQAHTSFPGGPCDFGELQPYPRRIQTSLPRLPSPSRNNNPTSSAAHCLTSRDCRVSCCYLAKSGLH